MYARKLNLFVGFLNLLIVFSTSGLAQKEPVKKEKFEPFPTTIPERKCQYDLAELTGTGTYALVAGPKWMTLSKEGILQMDASAKVRGKHELTYTVTRSEKTDTVRFQIEVATGQVKAIVGARRPLPPGESKPGTFQRLPTEALTTAIEVSEDGKFLFAAHQEANKVSVWDLWNAKLISTLESPAPSALLFRAGKLFVGGQTQKSIQVFSQQEGWKLSDELKIDGAPVISFTAPRGEFFHDTIICNVQGGKLTPYVIDIKKDKPHQLFGMAGVAASADAIGRYMMVQQFGLDYNDAIYHNSRLGLGEGSQIHRFAVPRGSGWWYAFDTVFQGMPPVPVAQEKDTVVVADLTRDLVYFAGETTVKARQLKSGLPELASQPIQFPMNYLGHANDGFWSDASKNRYLQQVAVTVDKTLLICLLSTNSREIFWTKMPTFEGRPVVESKPASEKSEGTLATAIEGKAFSGRWPGADGKKTFNLISGPDGLKVADDGTLAWMPGKAQIGKHNIKVRVTAGSKVTIEQLPIEVLDKELVAGAKGDLSKVADFSSIELDQGGHRLIWSLDKKNLLLLQGRKLYTLSSDGLKVENSIQFERYCDNLAERPEYYIGLSRTEMRLLDKKTGKTIKAFSLEKFRQVHPDLVVNPNRKVAYISIENTVEAIVKNRAEYQRVIQVDEENGNITELKGVFGRFLAIDPEGKNLYVGFKDIYTKGINLNINPDGRIVTFPKYGNIDILLRYDIDGDRMKLVDLLHDAGGNGKRLVLSPDGTQVSYMSNGGYPVFSRNVVAFNCSDFKQDSVTFVTKDKSSCESLAHHPSLPLVASIKKDGAVFFDRKTGAESPDRLKMTAQALGTAKAEDISFSPDGKYLIFVLSEQGHPLYLRSVQLNLSPLELKKMKSD